MSARSTRRRRIARPPRRSRRRNRSRPRWRVREGRRRWRRLRRRRRRRSDGDEGEGQGDGARSDLGRVRRRARRAGRDEGRGPWRVAGQELKLTNLDKVLFPPRDGVDEPALTKRDLIAYFARIAPAMLPHLADRPLNLQRFPNGAGGAGLLAEGHPVVVAQVAHDLARDRLPRARGPGRERPPGRGPRGDAVLAGQPGVVRDPRLDLHDRGAVDADVRADRHRPRHEDDLGRDARASRGSTGPPSSTSASARYPKTHRQPRHPGVDPHRARPLRVRGHVARGSRSCRGRSAGRCPTSCRGSGRRPTAAARRASTTPRTRRSRRSWRRTRSARGRAPRVRADPLGGARRPDAPPRPLDDQDAAGARRRGRRPVGGLQEDHQVLPPL